MHAVRAWHGRATRRPDSVACIVLRWRDAWWWMSVHHLSSQTQHADPWRHPVRSWGRLPDMQLADCFGEAWRRLAPDRLEWHAAVAPAPPPQSTSHMRAPLQSWTRRKGADEVGPRFGELGRCARSEGTSSRNHVALQ